MVLSVYLRAFSDVKYHDLQFIVFLCDAICWCMLYVLAASYDLLISKRKKKGHVEVNRKSSDFHLIQVVALFVKIYVGYSAIQFQFLKQCHLNRLGSTTITTKGKTQDLILFS